MMRLLAVLIVGLCLLVPIAFGSDGDEAHVETLTTGSRSGNQTDVVRTPLAVIEAKEKLDLGVIQSRAIHTRKVRLTNTSGRPIRVSMAGVTCSCVGVTIDQEEIAPGGFTDIWMEIALLTPGSGDYLHKIFLDISTTDEGEDRSSRVALDVRYRYERSFEVEPGEMYPLHYETCVGTKIRRRIALINHADKGVRPTGVTFHEIEGWRLVSIEQQDSWHRGEIWWVTLEGEWDSAGTHNGWVTIATTDDLIDEWSVRMSGRVYPPSEVLPGAKLVEVGEATRFDVTSRGGWETISIEIAQAVDGIEIVSSGASLVVRAMRPGSVQIPIRIMLRKQNDDEDAELVWEDSIRLIARHAEGG